MISSKTNPPPPPRPPYHYHHYYTPIPPQPHDQNSIVLPYYHDPPEPKPRPVNWHVIIPVVILLLAALVYILWPSGPHLKIERLRLTHVKIHTRVPVCIDITLNVTLKVQNVDVYSMDYKSLDVKVGYRGRKLGHVKSGKGHVRALGSSHVNAKIELECVKVFSDFVFFVEDLARGTVPFDTVTEVHGHLGLFFFRFYFETKLSCEVLVNKDSQTIIRQHCHRKH
ncbi:hypothetical protein LWI29_004651 [Acer saccharum]|uniref:Late embryogenesis abundant protein LEA-2 subgroup domain-containing protein n=1 Tax=Acer saccharum TaxID=4024 RepID=A0AA39VQT5_ACESA|nr:hypothetical protein LWI29_004651 [Acer saccharum]